MKKLIFVLSLLSAVISITPAVASDAFSFQHMTCLGKVINEPLWLSGSFRFLGYEVEPTQTGLSWNENFGRTRNEVQENMDVIPMGTSTKKTGFLSLFEVNGRKVVSVDGEEHGAFKRVELTLLTVDQSGRKAKLRGSLTKTSSFGEYSYDLVCVAYK